MLKKLLFSALISAMAFGFVACGDDKDDDNFNTEMKSIINSLVDSAKGCELDAEDLSEYQEELESVLKFYKMSSDECYPEMEKAIIKEYQCYEKNFSCRDMMSEACDDDEWEDDSAVISCMKSAGKKAYNALDAASKKAFEDGCDHDVACQEATKEACMNIVYESLSHYDKCQKSFVNMTVDLSTCFSANTACSTEADKACEIAAESKHEDFSTCVEKYTD